MSLIARHRGIFVTRFGGVFNRPYPNDETSPRRLLAGLSLAGAGRLLRFLFDQLHSSLAGDNDNPAAPKTDRILLLRFRLEARFVRDMIASKRSDQHSL
jgi:hypothetical protein